MTDRKTFAIGVKMSAIDRRTAAIETKTCGIAARTASTVTTVRNARIATSDNKDSVALVKALGLKGNGVQIATSGRRDRVVGIGGDRLAGTGALFSEAEFRVAAVAAGRSVNRSRRYLRLIFSKKPARPFGGRPVFS